MMAKKDEIVLSEEANELVINELADLHQLVSKRLDQIDDELLDERIRAIRNKREERKLAAEMEIAEMALQAVEKSEELQTVKLQNIVTEDKITAKKQRLAKLRRLGLL